MSEVSDKTNELNIRYNDGQMKDKIGLGEYTAFGAGGAGIVMLNSILASYIMIYMTNVALLDVAVISVIIAVSKLLDGISDLIIGDIIDNTTSKMGKARVWLLRMCLPFAVSMMLLFWVPPHFPTAVRYIYVFLMYNIANTVIFTFLQISQLSMVSLMSHDRKEQGILGNIVSLARMISGLIGNVFFVRLLLAFTDEPGNQNTQRAYTMTIIIYGAVMVVLTLIMVACTRERVTVSIRKPGEERPGLREKIAGFRLILADKYWLSMMIIRLLGMIAGTLFASCASYYALYVLNDMSLMSWLIAANMAPSITILLITPFLMKKINRRKMFLAGLVVSMIGTAGVGIFGNTTKSVVAFLVVCSLGSGLFNAVMYGLIADIVLYTKQKTGQFVAGTGNAGVSAASKIGQGLANVILGFSLSAAGFNAMLDVQPDSVITMIRVLYAWMPFVCFMLSAMLFVFYFDLDKKMEQIETADN